LREFTSRPQKIFRSPITLILAQIDRRRRRYSIHVVGHELWSLEFHRGQGKITATNCLFVSVDFRFCSILLQIIGNERTHSLMHRLFK
jgi:hypothetical protein